MGSRSQHSSTKQAPIKFNINGSITSDNNLIAKAFNNYCTSIGTSLARHIPVSSKNPTDYIRNNIVNSLFLNPVYSVEVEKIISDLKDSSPDWDGITAKIVKRSKHLIVHKLTHLLTSHWNMVPSLTNLK